MASYAELELALYRWLWRDDSELRAAVPSLVAIAHSRLNRNLRLTSMMTRATYNGAGDRYIPIPGTDTDSEPSFLDMRAIRLYLEEDQFEQMYQVAPEGLQINPNGHPTRYTIHREIELNAPLADGNVLEMIYWTPFPAIYDETDPDDKTGTNWLLENAFDSYLYGALQEAEPLLRNDERLPVWSQRWQLAVDELRTAEERRRVNQSEIRQMMEPSESTP